MKEQNRAVGIKSRADILLALQVIGVPPDHECPEYTDGRMLKGKAFVVLSATFPGMFVLAMVIAVMQGQELDPTVPVLLPVHLRMLVQFVQVQYIIGRDARALHQ